jgi:23S rRNA (guanosine2251-2'-O)-methyltransferase
MKSPRKSAAPRRGPKQRSGPGGKPRSAPGGKERSGPGGKERRTEKPRPRPERRGEKPAAANRPGKAPPTRRPPEGEKSGRLWIYGRHAAIAALANPARKIRRILVADNALGWISEARLPKDRLTMLSESRREDFAHALHEGAVHQGIAVEVEELPRARLRDVCQPDERRRPVVVLDQITDPHNIGAIFRSAAAFGARAVIVQDRRTPPLAGALAKAAAGAVELVPCIEVVNVSRALEALKELGYHCAGLAGEAAASITELPADKPTALVLGAEGEGLRRLVAETCDRLYRIPISRRMESLNVSNAAAVSLYEISRNREAKT